MWFGIWASRRGGERQFEEFKERYAEFRKEDVHVLCDRHHAEIHEIYDKIISEDKKITDRRLAEYSWTQAHFLMDKFEDAFYDWLEEETPGIGMGVLKARRSVRKIFK